MEYHYGGESCRSVVGGRVVQWAATMYDDGGNTVYISREGSLEEITPAHWAAAAIWIDRGGNPRVGDFFMRPDAATTVLSSARWSEESRRWYRGDPLSVQRGVSEEFGSYILFEPRIEVPES